MSLAAVINIGRQGAQSHSAPSSPTHGTPARAAAAGGGKFSGDGAPAPASPQRPSPLPAIQAERSSAGERLAAGDAAGGTQKPQERAQLGGGKAVGGEADASGQRFMGLGGPGAKPSMADM